MFWAFQLVESRHGSDKVMIKKKIVQKLSLKHIFTGVFCGAILLFAMLWFSAPIIFDWGIRYLSSAVDPEEFDVQVEQLDPWETRINQVVFNTEEANLKIGSVHLQYDPVGLALGDLNSFTVRNLDLTLDGKYLLDEALSEKKVKEEPNIEWLGEIGEFLSDPRLKHLRVLNSDISLMWTDLILPLKFELKGDYNEGLARSTFDGDFAEFPFLSELRFWREENDTYADIQLEFTDLNKSKKLKSIFERFSGVTIGDDLSFNSGDLVMEGVGRIDGNMFQDLFLEFNGTNIFGELNGFPFSIHKFISFITPKEGGDLDSRTYANLEIPSHARFRGIALGADLDGEIITIRPSVQNIDTSETFGQMSVRGLSLPVVDLNFSNGGEFPLDQPLDIFFDSWSVANGAFSLMDGRLNFIWNEDIEILGLQVLPLTAILSDLNIRLLGLSFNGLLNPVKPLYPKFNQILSCEKAVLGEDSLIENLSLSFRTAGESVLQVNSVTARVAGILADFSPANVTVILSEENPKEYKVDFNGSDIRLGGEKFIIDGLSGSITIQSFDPLLTSESNQLTFKKLTAGDLVMEDGNFSFAVNEGGEFIISNFSVRGFGGSIEVESAKWRMYTDFFKFETKLSNVNGQQIADFFDELGVNIDGNFSGLVSFSNYDGVWDFGTGFLQLDPSENAHIKFKKGDMIYGGIDPNDPQNENLKLTAWALQDLAVDGMRINFKVLENERQIIMSINGVRETDDRKVDLDYKPRFLGGLQDLLNWKANMIRP